MRFTLPLIALAAATPALAKPQLRCGWLDNPSPAAHYLTDREGSWIIEEQFGYVAPGWSRAPNMQSKGWRKTDNLNGYGCACMTVDVDRRTTRVTRIYSASPRPLKQCDADKALPKNELGQN